MSPGQHQGRSQGRKNQVFLAVRAGRAAISLVLSLARKKYMFLWLIVGPLLPQLPYSCFRLSNRSPFLPFLP
jgi:mitochondrial fission protein ELM1